MPTDIQIYCNCVERVRYHVGVAETVFAGSPIGGDAVSTLYGGRGIPWERILRAARFYYLRDDCVDDSTYLEARRFQM